jgi:hypothetical protein
VDDPAGPAPITRTSVSINFIITHLPLILPWTKR